MNILNSLLLGRSAGLSRPNELEFLYHKHLLYSLQLSNDEFRRTPSENSAVHSAPQAHFGGVNAITIDRFNGRYLVSGGIDGSLSIWDLDHPTNTPKPPSNLTALHHHPLHTTTKTTRNPTGPRPHQFGITSLSFFPFDSDALLSTSYDHHLQLTSTSTLLPGATFDLSTAVYTHAISPIANHLLVACGTQHPSIRLVDLRSGNAVQALAGHTGGAVLAVAWSPTSEWTLASGGADGAVKLWDVRAGAGAAETGRLDWEDAVGWKTKEGGASSSFRGARGRISARAHGGPVNGITWTQDGRFLVTAGHDEKVRLWDVNEGRNTLANFGPLVKNKSLSGCVPCLVPGELLEPGKDVMLFPSEREILMFELFDAKLIRRLRLPGSKGQQAVHTTGPRRIMSLAWRNHSTELYSAQTDGTIRAWKPYTSEDAEAEQASDEDQERRQKRKLLDDIYQDLTKRRMIPM